MRSPQKPSTRLAGALCLLSACAGGGFDGPAGPAGPAGPLGTATEPSSSPDMPGNGTGDPVIIGGAQTPLKCTTPAVGPMPMRRITHREYNNSVRDLLNDTSLPAQAFPGDTQIGLFDNSVASQTIPVLLGEQYLQAAETLAQAADVHAVTGCSDLDGTSAPECVRSFIQRFGRRAYRRPLTVDEVAGLLGVYQEVRAEGDGSDGVRAVLASMLSSPLFLFHLEFGEGDDVLPNARRVTAFELAARLSTLLWASVPDDVLLDAAAEGRLATRADVEREARRMVQDPRARVAVRAFFEQWLGLWRLDGTSKDPNVYPEFDPALRDSMLEETRRFVDDVIWEGDAQLSTLLTAPYTFVNAPLAELYGLRAPADPASFEKVSLDQDQRLGILTHASILSAYARADQSSPILRGEWVRVRLLCQDLPPPPNDIPELPAIEEGATNRERFAMHTSSPACSGCHNLIDGIGFGFEHYDGIGRYRTDDLGVRVDATGELLSTLDIDGPYTGGPELAARLAESEQVRDCLPTQWLRYSLGRREGEDDACSLKALRTAFADSNGNIRELLVQLTQTDLFWHYRPPEE